MSARSTIENWLNAASLPSGISRTFNERGFWSMGDGSVGLTLAVSEKAERFFLYLPLLRTGSAPERRLPEFFREILSMQLRGELPAGLMFGLNREDDMLSLTGAWPLRSMDAVLFDELIHASLAAAVRLRPQLEALLATPAAGENDVSLGSETSPAASSAPRNDAAAQADNDYLLMYQMLQNMQA